MNASELCSTRTPASVVIDIRTGMLNVLLFLCRNTSKLSCLCSEIVKWEEISIFYLPLPHDANASMIVFCVINVISSLQIFYYGAPLG